MSTPNPTHIDIISRALADTADDGCFDNPPCCDEPPCSDSCGTDLDEWHSGEEDREHWTKLARASVSKLTDAGYSIVRAERVCDLERFAKHVKFVADDLGKLGQSHDDRTHIHARNLAANTYNNLMSSYSNYIGDPFAAATEGEKP